MKTIKIELIGTVRGTIWMPAVECTKDFDINLSREDKPFTRKINCLRDALLHITNDGDFQYCEIEFAVLIVTKQKGFNTITRERIMAGRGESSDCFVKNELQTA